MTHFTHSIQEDKKSKPRALLLNIRLPWSLVGSDRNGPINMSPQSGCRNTMKKSGNIGWRHCHPLVDQRYPRDDQ